MEVRVENQQSFAWRRVEETIQLVFEQHPHASAAGEDLDIKSHDMHGLKKGDLEDAVHQSEVYHQDGSKEIFEGHERSGGEPRLTARLQGALDLDLANGNFLSLQRATIPPIIIRIDPGQIRAWEQSPGAKDGKLVVEILFAQKSHSSERQKYKIYRSGVGGWTRKKYVRSETLEFSGLRLNYPSSLDKNSKLLVVLYQLGGDRKKVLREVLMSSDLFVIEENKLINIDTQEALHQYFDLFGSEFMDKLPTPFKPNKNDKHGLNQEISNLEKYLTKKNKKFLNIVYLSFKFPHFCELYFKANNIQELPESQLINFRKTALSNALAEATREIQELKLEGDRPQMLCNFVNPLTKLIFRVNVNLRRVRIFMRKQLTEILSIVVAEDFQPPESFINFSGARELKEFYLQYYSFARKCKSSQSFGKQANNSSAFLQNPADANSKKNSKRPQDEQYNQQQGEDQDDSEIEEEEDAESGDKKGKKPALMIKKLYTQKKTTPGNSSPKESKYPTRNKTRAQDCQQSSHNESKRNNNPKKAKQLQKKPNGNILPPGMGAGMNPMMPMPFQMMSQGGQNPIMGMFPMMQNPQKKDGQQQSQVPKMIPISMPGMPGMQGIPGMSGLPAGMQMPGGMAMGGVPIGIGMNSMGMPMQGMQMMPGFGGMPMGMMPPNQQHKKEGAKDGKDEPATNQKPGMPMMIPMMGNGMGMPMMQMPMMGGQMMGGQIGYPMGQGMMGMQIPVMQGPNGQLMMMQMMPQQMQQFQQQMQQQQPQQQSNSNSNTAASTSSSNSSSNQTPGMPGMIQGNLPFGMMMPGVQGGMGMQGMMLPQGMSMMGMPGNSMGMMGAPNQAGTSQQPISISQISGGMPNGMAAGLQAGMQGMGGMGGIPMGFMIPQNQAQNSLDQKSSDKNNTQKPPQDLQKKNQSGKKDEKCDTFPPSIESNNPKNTSNLPSFLNPQGQFTAIIPSQGKEADKGMVQKVGLAQTAIQPGMMGMPPGMPPGMIITPQMLQQLQNSQGGMIPMGLPPQGMALSTNDPAKQQQMQLMHNQMMQMQMRGFGGMPGMPGMSGMQGIPGMQGMQSMQGMQGMPGMQGMQGLPGMSGMSNFSAQPKKDEEKK